MTGTLAGPALALLLTLGGSPDTRPHAGTLEWTVPFSFQSGFATNDQSVFFFSFGESDEGGALHQLDLKTGAARRTSPMKGRCADALRMFADAKSVVLLCHTSQREEGPGPTKAVGPPSSVLSFDASSGRPRWTYVMPMDSGLFSCDSRGCALNMLASVITLDGATGRPLWESRPIPQDLMMFVDPVATATSVFAVSDDDFGKTRLFSFARKSGKVQWKKEISGGTEVLAPGHFVVVSAVVTGSCPERGKPCAPPHTTHLASFEQRTGAVLWEKELSGVSELAALGGLLFVTNGGVLRALELTDGQERWRLSLGLELAPTLNVQTEPVVSAESVLVWTYDAVARQLVLTALDPTTGAVAWTWPLASPPSPDGGPRQDPNARVLGAQGDRVFVNADDRLSSIRAFRPVPAAPE